MTRRRPEISRAKRLQQPPAACGAGHPDQAGKTVLLGLGNDILRDDAIGLRVVGEVRRRLAGRRDIAVVETGEMGLGLLDFVAGCRTLVVVDAVQTGRAPPGFVHELAGRDINSIPSVAPHGVGLGEVLALGRELGFCVPDQVKIFAIEVADPFTVSAELTPELRAALPGIVERVMHALAPPV